MRAVERSRGRALALQALCGFETAADDVSDRLNSFLNDAELYADLGWDEPPGDSTLRFARELALGAYGLRGRCDEILARLAHGWSLARMTPVDRNILRLGAYELLERRETPAAVVIDEAVELAKRFGDQDSPAFVNGVLDALRREREGADGAV
jgi:N utilization substance protein B